MKATERSEKCSVPFFFFFFFFLFGAGKSGCKNHLSKLSEK